VHYSHHAGPVELGKGLDRIDRHGATARAKPRQGLILVCRFDGGLGRGCR
jgi:hypothetical protein